METRPILKKKNNLHPTNTTELNPVSQFSKYLSLELDLRFGNEKPPKSYLRNFNKKQML